MNSLEFSTIASVTNIDSSASNEAPNHKVVQVINWNGFNLKFIELKHRESYIVVEGLVPEEVEALLDKQNDIKCMTFLENSNRKVYNINSKEGLLSFFTTMSSYYREHNISCEKSVDNYDSLLAEANAILLEISKPGASTSDCVQTNPSLLKIYNKSNEILATTDLGQELRECLNNFDETINPFLNKSLEIAETSNCDQRLIFSMNSGRGINGSDINQTSLSIKDSETVDSMKYYRYNDRLGFELIYTMGEEQSIPKYSVIHHYYSCRNPDKFEYGELVDILIYTSTYSINFNIVYNVTTGKIYNNLRFRNVTEEDLEYIIQELNKAIEYANDTFVDKLKKQPDWRISLNNTNQS